MSSDGRTVPATRHPAHQIERVHGVVHHPAVRSRRRPGGPEHETAGAGGVKRC